MALTANLLKYQIADFSASVLPDPLAQQVLHYKKHCDWLAKIMGKDPESFSSEELQVMKLCAKLDCRQVHVTIKIMD